MVAIKQMPRNPYDKMYGFLEILVVVMVFLVPLYIMLKGKNSNLSYKAQEILYLLVFSLILLFILWVVSSIYFASVCWSRSIKKI